MGCSISAEHFEQHVFADFLLGIPLSATGGLGSVGNFGGVAKYSIGHQVNGFRAGRLESNGPAHVKSWPSLRSVYSVAGQAG